MNNPLFDLGGRVAIVTGASEGIGKAVTLSLAREGVDVARLVSQIMGSDEPAIEPSTSAADAGKEPASDPPQSRHNNAKQELEPGLPTQAVSWGNETTSIAEGNTGEGVCIEGEQPKDFDKPAVALRQTVRRHGSAKPST